MAITIDWGTKVINIPKADLTLVQATPTEIRELSLNAFRLELRALEASEDGIPFPVTHNHNTEVILGGITYARIIEIINGYTVTFENDQYAVNLVGANSNVGDVVNVNQVSVRSQNSAGLISNQAIEFSSFGGGVTIDENNTTGNAVPGTVFPIGTLAAPSNNLGDLDLIGHRRGLTTVFVEGDLDLNDSSHSWGDHKFIGHSVLKTTIVIDTITSVLDSEFENCTINGHLDGDSEVRACTLNDVINVGGFIRDSAIGNITISPITTTYIWDSKSLFSGNVFSEINMSATGILSMNNWSGCSKLINYSGGGEHNVFLNSGMIMMDSTTITGGVWIFSGVGVLFDENYIPIETSTQEDPIIWNGTVTIVNELINKDFIVGGGDSVWSTAEKDLVISDLDITKRQAIKAVNNTEKEN